MEIKHDSMNKNVEIVKCCLKMLPHLSIERIEERNMVTIVVSHPHIFLPQLFQIVDNYDGKFLVQHLQEKTHKTLYNETLDFKKMMEVTIDKILKLGSIHSISVTYGTKEIFSYTDPLVDATINMLSSSV